MALFKNRLVTGWGIVFLCLLSAVGCEKDSVRALDYSDVPPTYQLHRLSEPNQKLEIIEPIRIQMAQDGEETKQIFLTGPRISDRSLSYLYKTKLLRGLGLKKAKVTDAGLEKLQQLEELIGLEIDRCPQVTGSGLVYLQKPMQLQYLTLRETPITDASLEHLLGMSELKSVQIMDTDITDAGIETLAEVSKLEELCLNDGPFSDAIAPSLAQMKNLTILKLSRTDISDATLEKLVDLQQLTIVELFGTKVTAAAVAQLEKALPNCHIYWDEGL